MARESRDRMDLQTAALAAKQLRDALRLMLDEEDDELVLDMIEGETDLIELIVQTEEQAAKDENDIAYCKQRMAQLQARKIRLETRAAKARQEIVRAMQTAQLQRIDRPDMTLSVAKGAMRVEILDLTEIPENCTRVRHELDKAEIARRLRAGEVVPGATLEEGPASLRVRRT